MTDKCSKCLRPVWDGGHALNARECSPYDPDACALAEELMLQRERAELAEKGIARLQEERDDLLDQINWYKSREKTFNEAIEQRSALAEEIERWRTIARDFCDAHDPMGCSNVTPGVFWAVAQGVSQANHSMREERKSRDKTLEEVIAQDRDAGWGEAAYWLFDSKRNRPERPMAERDAFKAVLGEVVDREHEDLQRIIKELRAGYTPRCAQCSVALGDSWCAPCAGSVTAEKIAQWFDGPEADARALAIARAIRSRSWK